jgi:hypothetical protein
VNEPGHLIALGPCWSCGERFTFDPDTVVSILVDPDTNLPPDLGHTDPQRAIARPLCPSCVERANRQRVAAGRPAIRPAPPLP